MKKLILMSLVLCSVVAYSQSYDLKTVNSVKFFGVDYSHVKVFGAEESPTQFQIAFQRINELFLAEADKYDMSKLIKKKVYAISTEEVNSQIEKMDLSNLMTGEKRPSMDQDQIQATLNELPIAPEEGVGVIFIAQTLNKPEGMGYYYLVFFDMQNKDIIYSIPKAGKAGGFGLRNFWANTIYQIIKSGKITYF